MTAQDRWAAHIERLAAHPLEHLVRAAAFVVCTVVAAVVGWAWAGWSR